MPLITKKDAAHMLGCKEQVIGWMAKYGVIHQFTVGRRMIVDQAELERLPYTYDGLDLSNEQSIKMAAQIKKSS